MGLLIKDSSLELWEEVIRKAEDRCAISLKQNIESYLVSLLIRYTNQPEIAKQILATAFLEAIQLKHNQRNTALQYVGDKCLLYAGLFSQIAEKKQVKISYFVELGRSAYAAIDKTQSDDLFWSLALQFVGVMDVLQSIREEPDLLPLQAYEQWTSLGSKRAFQILQTYTQGLPIKHTIK